MIFPPSGRSSSLSLSWGTRSFWSSSLMPPRKVVLSFLIATMIVFGSSFLSLVLPARGSLTSTPFWSMGVITMKMMSSTIMMSAMGVTLMAAMAPPFLPPTAIDIGRLLDRGTRPGGPRPRVDLWRALRALLDEVVEKLRAGVVHLHVEPLDLAREEVVGPDRGDGHEEAERRGDQGFRDAGGDGGDTARARQGHAREGVDDAEGGPEEAHERRRGSDGGQAAEAALEVGQVDGGRTLDGALGGVDGGLAVAGGLTHFLLVLPFLQSDDQDLGQVGVLHGRAVRSVDRLLDLPLFQEAGDLGRVLAGLLGGLGVGVVPLDHDANRVDGHERKDDHDAPGDPAHVLRHGPEIKLHFLSPPGQDGPLSEAGCYDSRKLTVTVMITGTGTPLRRVGL